MKKIRNADGGFYEIMGPIFGSRKIQRVTGDRFYDDDSKEWYIDVNGDDINYAIGIKDGIIKNVYSECSEKLVEALIELHPTAISGVVPAIYEESYKKAGYKTIGCGCKNYIKIERGNKNA